MLPVKPEFFIPFKDFSKVVNLTHNIYQKLKNSTIPEYDRKIFMVLHFQHNKAGNIKYKDN